MRRCFACFMFVFILIGFHSHAQAQCTTPAIPGLGGSGAPCADNFTPNTPSTPSDGPNATGSPNQGKHEHDACDADFMNQIYARSYLEANRELMISQLLVVKPDSVLEYSCFDQSVRDTARIAGPIFSGTNAWLGSASGAYSSVPNPGSTFPTTITLNTYMGSTRLGFLLNALVMRSLNNFVNTNNFTHTFLGGSAGTDDTVAVSIASAGSTCTHMMDVWNLAKCENINSSTFFMTFSDIVASDPRDTIAALSCGNNPLTTTLIEIANNDAGTYAFKDDVQSYVSFLNAGSSVACEDPIPTGLMVLSQKQFTYSTSAPPTVTPRAAYRDYVCSNPGCFYRHSSTSCERVP